MTPQQTAHLQRIKDLFCSDLDTKYARGQQEHGGNLWDRPCLTELGFEIVDLVTYFSVVRDNLVAIQANAVLAREHMTKGKYTQIQECLDTIYHLSRP